MNVSSPIPLSSLASDNGLVRELGQGQTPAQIESVATQFESVFMSLLAKELRESTEGGLFPGESSDTLGGMFDLYMGQHMAEGGGIGIKQMLVSRYQAQQDAALAADAWAAAQHQAPPE
jgi:Rod binding domain-containing protein